MRTFGRVNVEFSTVYLWCVCTLNEHFTLIAIEIIYFTIRSDYQKNVWYCSMLLFIIETRKHFKCTNDWHIVNKQQTLVLFILNRPSQLWTALSSAKKSWTSLMEYLQIHKYILINLRGKKIMKMVCFALIQQKFSCLFCEQCYFENIYFACKTNAISPWKVLMTKFFNLLVNLFKTEEKRKQNFHWN